MRRRQRLQWKRQSCSCNIVPAATVPTLRTESRPQHSAQTHAKDHYSDQYLASGGAAGGSCAPAWNPSLLQCGAYRHKAGTSNLNHTHRRTWGLQSGIRAFTQFAEWETVLTPPSSDTSLGQGKGCGKLGTQRSCPGNQPQSQLCPRGRGVIPRRFRENSEARSERISDT